MNNPPPVRFPAANNLQWGGVIIGVWLLALIPALAGWALYRPARAHGLASSLALMALIVGAALALRLWQGRALGTLVWNGEQWFLENLEKGTTAVAITPAGIRFDGQCWLLLCVRAGHRTVWLWVGRSADSLRWHALRCALYAQVRTPSAPA
jgi:hypothetical protein